MDFEKISKKVMKISKDTVTEVQKMNEVRQLNAKVNEEKKLLNCLYMELGQKLYDKYKDVEIPLEGFESEFGKIEERYRAMDLLQDQIRAVKGVVLCPCCNMEVAVTERYCSNCGNKMPEVIKIEDKTDEDAVVVESEVIEPEMIDGQDTEAEDETACGTETACKIEEVEAEADETGEADETEEAEAETDEAACETDTVKAEDKTTVEAEATDTKQDRA